MFVQKVEKGETKYFVIEERVVKLAPIDLAREEEVREWK